MAVVTRPWRNILSGVRTDPTTGDAGNVVALPRPSLDELYNRVVVAQNAVVERGAAVDLAGLAYKTALDQLKRERALMADAMKELGADVRFTQQFPELDMIDVEGKVS